MRRGRVLAVVVLVAAVEVAAFVAVAWALGAGWAVLLAAASSLAGLVLLRREGLRGWRRFRAAAEAGRPPGLQVTDGVVGLAGALLMAVPGFVTAVVGLLLVVPGSRGVARWAVRRAAERRVPSQVAGDLFGPRRVRVRRGDPVPRPRPDAPVVAGEVVAGEVVVAPLPAGGGEPTGRS